MGVFIEIVRYSRDGFAPKLQTKHLEKLIFLASRKWENDPNTFKYGIYDALNQRANTVNYSFMKGVWVFVGFQEGLESTQLNHLPRKERSRLRCWKGKLPIDAVVYNPMGGDVFLTTSVAEARTARNYCFIPESSIPQIYDVEEIQNRYALIS